MESVVFYVVVISMLLCVVCVVPDLIVVGFAVFTIIIYV